MADIRILSKVTFFSLMVALFTPQRIAATLRNSPYPCFRHVKVLQNRTVKDDMPDFLKRSLEQEASKIERYIVSIPTHKHLCEYIQKKLIVVFHRLYNVEIDIFDMEKKLTNISKDSNGKTALDFKAKLYLLSIDNLINKVVLIKRENCQLKGGKFLEKTLECAITSNEGFDKNFTSAEVPLSHPAWLGLAVFGNIASILSQLILFVIYWKTTGLEMIFPRKCVLHLSALQFLLQLLQLTSLYVNKVFHICTGISILSHWVALCTFVWLSCISLEINWLLSRQCMLNKEERLVGYSSVSFGLTAIIVLSCTILHFSSGRSIGYGNGPLCFVGDRWTMFYSFLLPTSILLLCNIAWTLCSYRRCAAPSKSNLQQETDGEPYTRNKLSFIYSSLLVSLVILLCRILETVSVRYSIVYCMAVVLTSLHGVFILIAMVANRKVLKAARSAFSRKKRDRVTYAHKLRDQKERRSKSCSRNPALI